MNLSIFNGWPFARVSIPPPPPLPEKPLPACPQPAAQTSSPVLPGPFALQEPDRLHPHRPGAYLRDSHGRPQLFPTRQAAEQVRDEIGGVLGTAGVELYNIVPFTPSEPGAIVDTRA